jgi:predicted enzyme related to lactoylglutathione lyase
VSFSHPGRCRSEAAFAALGAPARSRRAAARNGKVRLHIDVQVDDIVAGRAQVEQLGGRWTGQRYDYPGEGVVIVMIDPEGHEFCLVQYF